MHKFTNFYLELLIGIINDEPIPIIVCYDKSIWVAVAVPAGRRMAEPAARRVLEVTERAANKCSGLPKEQTGVRGHGSRKYESTSDRGAASSSHHQHAPHRFRSGTHK